jgi:hypothetical protein
VLLLLLLLLHLHHLHLLLHGCLHPLRLLLHLRFDLFEFRAFLNAMVFERE